MENNVNNTNNSKLQFEAFAIPNRILAWDDMPQYLKDRVYAENERLGIRTDDYKYVQVWILSEELGIENATDHGFPKEVCDILGLDYETKNYYAPSWVPLNQISTFKEGDILKTVSENGTAIEIKFAQRPYRYGNFGTLEEVLEQLK